jgi:DNA-binding FadR family transcriptional regulator
MQTSLNGRGRAVEGSSAAGNVTTIKGLEPIRVVSMNEAIQERLQQFIREQGLSAGDRLPSENRLARSLGVSRNALREALRSLEALGIVEARVGSGWYVREVTFDAVAEALILSLEPDTRTLDGLYRIRACLECGFIGDAIRALTAESLQSLRCIVDAMERRMPEDPDLIRLDRDFHRTLFSGLGNPVLSRLIDLFFKIVEYERRQFPLVQSLVETVREHQAILDALEVGDEELVCRIITASFEPYLALASGASQT